MSEKIEHLLSVNDECGESPIWIAEEAALYWIDIEGKRGHRFEASTKTHTVFDFKIPVTAIAPTRSRGWITATKTGLYRWDSQFRNPRFLCDPVADIAQVRFNDGVVDRQGHFWCGTLNEDELEAPDGALFCLKPDQTIHEAATGFAVANGITWSPDGQILYITNMFQGIVEAFDQDTKTGSLTNRRVFVKIPDDQGLPDGLTVDQEGFVWVAHWAGSRISRFHPSGRLERQIRFPVENVTRCTFGGENLDELYVTTAWYGLDETQQKTQPEAGDLYRVKINIKGLEEERFLD